MQSVRCVALMKQQIRNQGRVTLSGSRILRLLVRPCRWCFAIGISGA